MVFTFKAILAYIIPDVPRAVKLAMRRVRQFYFNFKQIQMSGAKIPITGK